MKFLSLSLLLFWTLLLPPLMRSQESDSLFLYGTYYGEGDATMPYRLFAPADTSSDRYPLVVWLHGAAGRGLDDEKNIAGNNYFGSHAWVAPAVQQVHPCFVLAPQCPEGQTWDDHLTDIRSIIEMVMHSNPVDRAHIYIVGQSMGAVGVWEFAAANPQFAAALVPVSGAIVPMGGVSQKLAGIPTWTFHGDSDEVVPIESTRRLVEAIQHFGGTPRFTEVKGGHHDIWERVFKNGELIDWLFGQKLVLTHPQQGVLR